MRASPSRKPVDCPLAPPPRRTTQARTLHCACLIVGGVPELAAHLRVPQSLLRDWLQGEVEPPPEMFLAAVEVILLHLDARGGAA
jgi:hypothetical protein